MSRCRASVRYIPQIMSSSSILKSHGGVLGQASKQAVKAFSRSHALEGLVLYCKLALSHFTKSTGAILWLYHDETESDKSCQYSVAEGAGISFKMDRDRGK